MRKFYYIIIYLFLGVLSSQAQTLFWVNGDGNWNDTKHWSLISGGQSCGQIPGLSNDVVFDKNSNSKNTTKIFLSNSIVVNSITTNVPLKFNGQSKIFYKQGNGLSDISINKNITLTKLKDEQTKGPGDPITIFYTKKDVTCHGDCDGWIKIDSLPGADPPVNYFWFDSGGAPIGGNQDSIGGLCVGTYTIFVSDADGDFATTDIYINEPGAIVVAIFSKTDVTCNGLCDGTITITLVTGGVGAKTHSWSNGASGPVLNGLCPGTYVDTITDANGCFITKSFTITQPPAISIDSTFYTPFICSGDTGQVYVEASGGTGSLTYDIGSGSQGNGDFPNLSAGTYTVTITDDNGCQNTAGPFVLQNNPAIIISDTHVNVDCNGNSTGSINITVSGGNNPYTYSWSTADGCGLAVPTNEDQNNLCAGTYDLVVTDSVGCTENYSVTITEPPLLTITNDSTNDISCNGAGDGAIYVTVNGGTPPYTYSWVGPVPYTNNIEDITNLEAGIYSLIVTDLNNCTATFTDTINEPLRITITVDSVSDISCNGLCDGAIYLTITDGTAPYIFNWSGPGAFSSALEDISGLCAGNYFVTVNDANGCEEHLDDIAVSEPPALAVTETHINPTCNASNNGSINLTVGGGTPPYSFNWSTADGCGLANPALEDQGSLCAGTYDVTVSDANGCSQTLSIFLSDPLAITITETHTDITCNGLTDGAIDITVSGGTGPGTYSYNWYTSDGSGLVPTDSDQTGLSAGTYTVVVTDNGPCTDSIDITIVEPPGMTITTDSVQNVQCNGNNDGYIYITVSGGVTPYTYNWQTPDGCGIVVAQEDQTNLCAGTYNLTVTDSNSCPQNTSWILNEPAALGLSETHTNPTCNLSSNGSIDITVVGGTGSYTYNWNTVGGSGLIPTDSDQTGLSAGTYYVTVTDGNGCQDTLSVVLNDPMAINISETHTNVSCNGLSDGSINITVSGGTGPGTYLFNWSTSDGCGLIVNNEDQNNLCAGTYYLTITDAGPCSNYDTITITEPDPIYSNGTHTNLLCFGDCNDTIILSPSGGTRPYTYTWLPNVSSDSIATGLCAGTYDISILDANACPSDTTINIVEPTELMFAGTQSNLVCFGVCNGSISIHPFGGTPPYSFTWVPNVSSDSSASGLCAGTYDVTISDNNGCTKDTSFIITEPTEIFPNGTQTNISCFGVCDGTISLNPVGGIPPYSYTWLPNVSSLPTAANLCAGTYNVTVTDANGCTKDTSFTIIEPNEIFFNGTQTNASCNSICDGTITLNPFGGTPPYGYTWMPNVSSDSSASGLCAGTYDVTITDNNGCTKDTSFTITEPIPISITLDSIHHVTCNGTCDGAIYITVSDGTPPYVFSWTGPSGYNSISEDITGLCAGTYNLTVTDANGCPQTIFYTINEPNILTGLISSSSDPLCNGDCNGTATVTVFGGTPPYSYSWNSGGISSTDTGLCAGTAIVTVTDSNNCPFIDSVALVDPPVLGIVVLNITNPLCYGDCDGSITINGSGGTSPYNYTWFDGGGNGNSHINLCAGTYPYTVIDAHGCIAIDSSTVTTPPQVTGTLTINNLPTCFGLCDGTVTVNPAGGVGGYTYLWTSGETTQTASSLCQGPDSVTVTDNNSCLLVLDTVLIAPVVVSIQVDTVINPLCFGDCNGGASVSASGGNSPYGYQWSNGDTNSTQNTLCDSTYFVTVTDNNGCQDTTSVHPIAPTALWDTILFVPPSCTGDTNGYAWVIDSGGTAPHTYLWSYLATTNDTLNNIGAGMYIVTITDANNCTLSDTVNVIDPPVLTYQIVSQTDPLCYNDCNGGITITGVGGTLPYSFNWSDGSTSASDTGLCSGTYYFTITDSSGCFVIDSVILNNPSLLTATMTDSSNVSCNGLCDGFAVATGVGGTPPYSYLWDANAGNQNIDSALNLCLGQYVVTVTDTNGCTAVDSVIITQPDSIIITIDTITDAYCGGCVGSIAISVTGGTLPYNYMWSNTTQTTDSITGLCPNIYSVTVTDTNNCAQINSAEVVDTSDLNITFTNVQNVSCNGFCDGSATASVTGGYPPYTFIWSTGGTDSTETNLCADTFYVTVTDTASCIRVGMIIIDESDVVTLTDSVNNMSCHDVCDGSIYIHFQGGTPPYTLLWGDGSSDTVLTGLCEGYYPYTLTDANMCTVIDSFEIVNPPALLDSLLIIDSISCNGMNDGAIAVIPSGGTAPYFYTWTDFTTDSIDTGLVAGTYYLTLTDTNGCSLIDSIILPEPDSLLGTMLTVNPPPCGGICSGSATVLLTGGTAPFSYIWSNGDTTALADSLCVDIFSVLVTDAHNCTFTDSIIMQDTSSLNLVLDTVISPLCYGSCNGTAIVGISGGFPPYSITWDDPASQTDTIAINLCAGNYTATVIDDSLCTSILPVSLTQPDSISILLIDSNLFTCYGDSTGTLTVSVSGGTPGYTYSWDNGQTDSVATNLPAGIHTIVVTDTLGCVDSLSETIISNSEILDSLVTFNSLCENNINDGSIDLYVSGGMSPYTYLWTTTDTIQNIDSLFGGWYTVTITDSLGCIKIDSALITGSIIVTAAADTDNVICPGDSIQIYGSGSDVFIWYPTTDMSDSTIKDPFVAPLVTTTYYFTAYDSICFDTDSVLISVYPGMTLDAGEDVEIMYDHPTQLQASGCDSNICTYLWIPSDGLDNDTIDNPMANPEQTTTYYLYITNENGCVFSDSVKVTVIPRLVIPNGITPNGDGINDIWMIDNINRFPNCEVFIFNRWGEQLFYSKGYPDDERWDGTYKGKNLPTGTYYYVINLHDDIITEPFTGPITIVK